MRRLAALVLLAACSGKNPPSGERVGRAAFPALPRTPAALAALVAADTRRPPPEPERELDASAVITAAESHGLGLLPAGSAAITRWIQGIFDRGPADGYLLFGTYHDAPGQLDAFRRLVGPGGLRGLHLVAAEMFRADGEWQDAPIDPQRGDGSLLELWSAIGDRAAFARLAEQHRDGDYAAWKLGYEDTVLDLLVTARAASVRVVGCDMPAALQDLSGLAPGDDRNRLREIHCLRSLPITWPRRAALVWGDAHVRRGGLVRFVSRGASVIIVHAFGQRLGGGTVEPALAKQLVVNDPVLVPLAADEAALLLPDASLGGDVDRVLVTDGEPGATGLTASASLAGTMFVGARALRVGHEPITVPLDPGDHTYAYVGGGVRVVGALRLAPGHRVELVVDADGRRTSYVEHAPR